MTDRLEDLLSRLRAEQALLQSGEEAIKQGAVLPILACLGWDWDNIREVAPEYSVGSGRVDYCLKTGEQPDVFVEAKRAGEELEKHQRQLLEYAFQRGVRIAILTNGLVWWFYLPLFEGSWEQRKFYAIDIREREIDAAASQFVAFLSREAVADGSAVKMAEATHKDRQKKRKARDAMPRAWRDLCEEPDELLVELLVEKVEALCGHRPDNDTAAEFLARVISGKKSGPDTTQEEPWEPDRSWTGLHPVAFSFKGKRVTVRSWRDVLAGLCEALYRAHGDEFEKLLDQKYFDRVPGNMHGPKEIADSGIYVEANLSANATVNRCHDVLTLFGYGRDALEIETREN
ncbi:MAG: restriction endonuclease subunit R [Planctomycetota bacterium]